MTDGHGRARRAKGAALAALAGTVATVMVFAVGGAADAATIKVVPSSNLAVGAGPSTALVSAPPGLFHRVPDPAATASTRSVTTKLGSAALVGPAGTFTAADLGAFVDDGTGGRVPDGVAATALTPLVPVYPRQGIPYVKAVNASGTTATLSDKALAAGTAPVQLIAPQNPVVLVTQASASIPFIADAIPGPGLCLGPLFPGGVCAYSAGNLAHDATKQVVFANADGSFTTPFTLVEGVMDGGIGTTPGPVYVKTFDPDGAGFAPFAPYGVPSTEPGATPITCGPGDADRAIPNPAIGGVDHCIVSAVALNAGAADTQVPVQLQQFPITWAASASGFVAGPDLAIVGHDFANNDVIVKMVVANGKAKVTGSPTVKCPALNRTITGVTASATGGVLTVIPDYAAGCTVPATSSTKVTIIGTKDVQQSQIPPNAVIGTSKPKKATALIPMAPLG